MRMGSSLGTNESFPFSPPPFSAPCKKAATPPEGEADGDDVAAEAGKSLSAAAKEAAECLPAKSCRVSIQEMALGVRR